MNVDFTFSKFEELCKEVSNSDYEKLNIGEYLDRKEKPEKCIILRHDVDVKIERALKMAKIESKHGISSTYYLRMTDEVFRPKLIKRIEELGHEIGYHYEVLDKAKGDKVKAINIFEQELNELRKLCRVDTICMHGNSRTRWNNRDIWNFYNFKDFGIKGEAYLSIDFSDMLYLSETGRNWGNKFKVKDNIEGMIGEEILSKIRSTDDIIELINRGEIKNIYLLSHPRWTDNFYDWFIELLFTNIKNVAKIWVVKYRQFTRNGPI